MSSGFSFAHAYTTPAPWATDDVERLAGGPQALSEAQHALGVGSSRRFDPTRCLPENRMNEEFVSWIESVGCGDIAREVGLIDETGKLP